MRRIVFKGKGNWLKFCSTNCFFSRADRFKWLHFLHETSFKVHPKESFIKVFKYSMRERAELMSWQQFLSLTRSLLRQERRRWWWIVKIASSFFLLLLPLLCRFMEDSCFLHPFKILLSFLLLFFTMMLMFGNDAVHVSHFFTRPICNDLAWLGYTCLLWNW